MTVELSLPALVNAAGALFFVLIGAFALIVAQGSRRAWSIGLAAVAFGLQRAVTNIFYDYGSPVFQVGQGLSELVAAGASLALAAYLVHDLPPRTRRAFYAFSTAMFAAAAISGFYILTDPRPFPAAYAGSGVSAPLLFNNASFVFEMVAVGIVCVACALRSRETPSERRSERRALGLLAVAFTSYAVFYLAPFGDLFLHQGVAWLAVVLACTTWLWAITPTDPGPARNVALTLQVFALAGLLFWGPLRHPLDNAIGLDIGAAGVIRTMGAFLLLLAILRHDLLEVKLPRASVERGPSAAAALAALFIVAQVAQNFLSAQYGLLMGGVVAGALLVATRPIERALDGRRDPRPPQGDAAKEDAFRQAIRLALRDRRITREEELHLHRVAQHMGIPTGRAHELLIEVERERPI